ncbi:hypothetical protein SDC9_186448 [bioreactor metagenome]|uniref:Uncharacterized protein n=1 Tax=bioreactor metagenome TaxID=1076179 RepID=A0A645HU68_9ZZZZ
MVRSSITVNERDSNTLRMLHSPSPGKKKAGHRPAALDNGWEMERVPPTHHPDCRPAPIAPPVPEFLLHTIAELSRPVYCRPAALRSFSMMDKISPECAVSTGLLATGFGLSVLGDCWASLPTGRVANGSPCRMYGWIGGFLPSPRAFSRRLRSLRKLDR